jgi:HK97 family phage major capsid protein
MNIGKKIEVAETDLVESKDELVAAMKALEEAPEDEELMEHVEELTSAVEAKQTKVAQLKRAEQLLMKRAEPVRPVKQDSDDDGTPAAPHISKKPSWVPKAAKEEAGDLVFKHAVIDFLSFAERRTPAEIIKERYGDDERVPHTYLASKALVRKSAVNPAMTTNAAWAGALVAEDTRGFITSMEEVSVAAALAARTQSFTFDGYGSIKVPVEDPLGAALTEPAWVGEAGVIPLTSFTFSSVTMNPYKLAAITTMSKEIVAYSTPQIEGIIRNSLRKAYAQVLDNALLNPAVTAVAGVRPASLTNGVVALPAGTGAADANIRADIYSLLQAHVTNRLGQNPVLIANNQDILAARMVTNALGEYAFRDELGTGSLLGVPVIASGHVPQGTIIMVDAAYFATAFGAIDFDVSDVATVTEANANTTAPTQANYGTAGAVGAEGGRVEVLGGIGVSTSSTAGAAGYTARSLWQTHSVGIKMVAMTSWQKLNPKAAQLVTGIAWK